MTTEAIQIKAAVWRMVGELGFAEALKRLSAGPFHIHKLDPERLRATADLLDQEADCYFIGYSYKGKFPDDEDGKFGHSKFIRLQSASKHLRQLSIRLEPKDR
jgi:hypothetical protein